jgi:hypothetical protein
MRNTRRVVVAAVAVATAGMAALAAPAGAATPSARTVGPLRLVAPKTSFHMTQSNNWSGYNQGLLEKSTTFSAISGTWTVPTATQHKAGEAESSATWVGIGGGCLETSCTATDNTLIQAGTGQDVDSSGKPTYYAWYELIPVPSTTVALPVSPGDTVRVDIAQTVPAVWSIAIHDVTSGKSFSTTVPYPSTMGSAEWIEETPLEIGTSGTGISAMPNLSPVHFTNSTANGASAGLTEAERMQLVGSSGEVLATPSTPNASATAFNDCSYATSCAAP